MECKKYTIIESYPSILNHNVFIIAFIILIVYAVLLMYELIKLLFLSFSKSFKTGFTFIKHFFVLRKNEHIENSTSFVDFNLESTNICNSKESEFNNIKKEIKETEIKSYSGIEALNILKELKEKYEITTDLSNLTKTNFILKEEIFYIDSNINLDQKDFILTKGYNKAAINTYRLFKNIL